MKFDFHQKTIDLLKIEPVISMDLVNNLDILENTFKFKIPKSVREWYSLEHSREFLQKYSYGDNLILLNTGNQVYDDWYGKPFNFIENGMILLSTENQGVCNWAVKIDDTDDPRVLIEVDTSPNMVWKEYINHFSEFIYVRAWDHNHSNYEYEVFALDTALNGVDLKFLTKNFNELHRTYYWPGTTNYRFFKEDMKIIIWDNQEYQADWYLYAKSEEILSLLIKQIYNCGTLKDTLESNDVKSKSVLRSIL